MCSKLTIEATVVVLVSLLLTLNVFDTFPVLFFAEFEQAKWKTFLS